MQVYSQSWDLGLFLTESVLCIVKYSFLLSLFRYFFQIRRNFHTVGNKKI